jgi:DNA polymerase
MTRAPLVIDFETYYVGSGPDAYSLRTMTAEEYIRDPRFEVTLVSVIDDTTPHWFSGTHDEVREWLAQFDIGNRVAIAHNAAFDMAILNWHFGIRPRVIVDTMSLASILKVNTVTRGWSLSLAALADALGLESGRKLDTLGSMSGLRRADMDEATLARFADYCVQDARLTLDLATRLLPYATASFLRHIDYTVRMFTEPAFVLDAGLLSARLEAVDVSQQKALAELSLRVGCTPDELGRRLRSDGLFAELLRAEGVEPATKISGTTSEPIFAFAKTDPFMASLLESDNDTVRGLAMARLGERSSLERNRLQRFLDISERGRLPVPLVVSSAHTGRYGGGEKINLQNLPKRRGGNKTLRKAMRAPDGYVVVAGDSRQIEVRVLAWLAGETGLLTTIAAGGDPYSTFAASLYGGDPKQIAAGAAAGEEPYKTQRQIAKSAVLGAGYGMGWEAFVAYCRTEAGLTLSEDESRAAIAGYRAAHQAIVRLWGAGGRCLRSLQARYEDAFGGPDNNVLRAGWVAIPGAPGVAFPGITLPDGFRLVYKDLTKLDDDSGAMVFQTSRGPRKLYGAKVIENVTQAVAFAVMRYQADEYMRLMAPYRLSGFVGRPRLNVHDEWVDVVPRELETAAKTALQQALSSSPPWAASLPLDGEVSSGETYGDV